MTDEPNRALPARDAAAGPTIYPVILSGGSGTRLWPMSRSAYPKQLLPLVSALSLLQESVRRVTGSEMFAAPVILANAEHRFIIAEQLRQIDVSGGTIMLEPQARNTAPAAVAYLAAIDPDALMLIMPSDHIIADTAAFRRAMETGRRTAASGRLVTFGLTPERPEIGYGYIRRGAGLVGRRRVRGGGVRRKARSRSGRKLYRVGRLYLEQRHFPVSGPELSERTRSLAAGHTLACLMSMATNPTSASSKLIRLATFTSISLFAVW
jgi:hypothetical protein